MNDEVLLSLTQTAMYIFKISFESLQLKKSIKPPEIPSKHVRNWVPKVLEQRRHGLELYLQVLEHLHSTVDIVEQL